MKPPRAATTASTLVIAAALILTGCHNSGSNQSSGAPSDGAATTPAGSTTTPTTPAATQTQDSGAAAAKLPPPCSLISASEASATLGSGVTSLDSSAEDDPDQISCIYLSKANDPVMVVLIRRWSLAKFNADAAQEPGHPQPVSGVGTAAYAGATEKGPFFLLWERGVSVLVNGVHPISASQVEFLAKVAVGTLDAPE